MSTVAELLSDLRGQGFTLATEGDRIRITPASRLTAEQRDLVRLHKAELLATLDLAAASTPPLVSIVSAEPVALDVPPPALAGDHNAERLDVPAEPTGALDLPADPAELQAHVDALTA